MALVAASASAALIAPGSSGVAVPGEVNPVGGVAAPSTATPFVSRSGPVAGFSGTLTSTVITGDTSNPLD